MNVEDSLFARVVADIVLILRKIDECAKDAQDGSATYALDRLRQIRSLVSAAVRKIERDRP